MKFQRYISSLLISLMMVLSLTACSSKEDATTGTTQEDIYFATPMQDGKPFNNTALTEIRLTPIEYSLLCGVIIDLSELGYTLDYLFENSLGIQKGDMEYEFYIAEAAYMNGGEEPDEVIDNIMFFYGDTVTFARIQYNDAMVSISTYYDSIDTAPMDTIKEEFLTICERITFEDISSDERYATVYAFDGVQFDCGWHATNVSEVEWGYNTLSFIYEDETITMEPSFRIETAENVESFLAPENADMYNLEPLLDKDGNEIGYVDLGMQSENYSNYLIRLEDGTYMEVQISGTDSSDATFPHNWEVIEEILNNGN